MIDNQDNTDVKRSLKSLNQLYEDKEDKENDINEDNSIFKTPKSGNETLKSRLQSFRKHETNIGKFGSPDDPKSPEQE